MVTTLEAIITVLLFAGTILVPRTVWSKQLMM